MPTMAEPAPTANSSSVACGARLTMRTAGRASVDGRTGIVDGDDLRTPPRCGERKDHRRESSHHRSDSRMPPNTVAPPVA